MVKKTKLVHIRFYVGAKRLRRGAPWPNEILPVDHLVDQLKQLDRGVNGNEQFFHNGRVVIGDVRSVTDHYAHLVFHRIRQDNLPYLRRGATGEIEDLDLDEDDALAESTEMLFFRNGVIAHAVNRDGPGSILSAMYLEEKTGVDVVMASLLRADALAQLREDDEVPAVTIKVVSGNWRQLGGEGDSLREAARAAATAPGTGSIEMIFRAEHGKKERFWDTWRPRLTRLVAGAEPGTIEKLKVQRNDADDHQAELVDLLEAKITATRQVEVQSRSRRLRPAAAEMAMVEAYNTEQAGILAAVQELRGLTFEDDAVEEAR